MLFSLVPSLIKCASFFGLKTSSSLSRPFFPGFQTQACFFSSLEIGLLLFITFFSYFLPLLAYTVRCAPFIKYQFASIFYSNIYFLIRKILPPLAYIVRHVSFTRYDFFSIFYSNIYYIIRK